MPLMLQSALAVSVLPPPEPELPPDPLPPVPPAPPVGSGVSPPSSDEQAKAPLTIDATKTSLKECIALEPFAKTTDNGADLRAPCVPPPRWNTSLQNGKHPFTETCFTWYVVSRQTWANPVLRAAPPAFWQLSPRCGPR